MVEVTEWRVVLEARPTKAGGLIIPAVSCFNVNARSAMGGGEAERDFVDVAGETDEMAVPAADWPRWRLIMRTMGSLSLWRDSSIPKRMAAASINWTCWCFDNRNFAAGCLLVL